MKLKIAELSDIDQVLELHYKYQVDSIDEEDKKDGFVTTPFTKEQLTDLISKDQGLFIAIKDKKVLAYVIGAASWQFWSIWPMFKYMIKDLHNLEYLGQTLSIDKIIRGSGALEEIFDFTI
ncbi:hypothetical protein [Sulfurimonas sp.]|uniref:hypothetical protein n=1 Tax=Sulfurimonas sp. TaxID=2022749 RepID=UPI00356A8474